MRAPAPGGTEVDEQVASTVLTRRNWYPVRLGSLRVKEIRGVVGGAALVYLGPKAALSDVLVLPLARDEITEHF